MIIAKRESRGRKVVTVVAERKRERDVGNKIEEKTRSPDFRTHQISITVATATRKIRTTYINKPILEVCMSTKTIHLLHKPS